MLRCKTGVITRVCSFFVDRFKVELISYRRISHIKDLLSSFFFSDPVNWNREHVLFWIQWAVKKFNLIGVNLNTMTLTGQELVELQHDAFVKYIPNDFNDIFWTHLELLRKCKFVGKYFNVHYCTFACFCWSALSG